jgi:predicted AlkP superfamily pyrophosphatase or phosphodiesterase
MNKQITYPDYNNCITGIPSSILKHYGAEPANATLPVLDEALAADYKNILFIIYDGMGSDILSDILPKRSFMRRNIKSRITSVFPPTTVAACTAYYSGQTPVEHGWLGWSLYFKEYDKQIDVFTDREARTGELSGYENTATTIMPYESIYSKIEAAAPGVKTYSLYPRGIDRESHPETVIGYDSLEDMHNKIKDLCKAEGSKFILAYHNEPDHLAHVNGYWAKEVKENVKLINRSTRKLCRKLSDTLVIISADHGYIDISKDIFLEEIPELSNMLLRPPSMEPRAVSLFVKPGTEDTFREAFNRILGDEFILFSREEVFENNLFGFGNPHPKSLDFIGDFIAAAKGQALLRYRIPDQAVNIEFLAHHAGLTAAEMHVPLIILKA